MLGGRGRRCRAGWCRTSATPWSGCGPCIPRAAKHPYGKLAPNGLLSATTETGVIKHWFGDLAPQANLGVVTDRLIAVDIDPRHGGDESLHVLEREHGEMPLTWRALSGGGDGGEHIIFARPDGVEVSNVVAEQMTDPPLGRGVDIRARGGYIIAPPSRHISGRSYTWSVDHHPRHVPLAPARRPVVAPGQRGACLLLGARGRAARGARPNADEFEDSCLIVETWR
jgi:hypothetical protein